MQWSERYTRLIGQRNALLDKIVDLPELSTRPKPNSWAIDEILRHQLGSEVRYVHQVIDPSLPQSEFVVPAQWVGNILFRLEEREHPPFDAIRTEFERIQLISSQLFVSVTPDVEHLIVKAPWGVEVPAWMLLEHFFEHDLRHQGQISYLYTYFHGPPDFVEPDKSVKYG